MSSTNVSFTVTYSGVVCAVADTLEIDPTLLTVNAAEVDLDSLMVMLLPTTDRT